MPPPNAGDLMSDVSTQLGVINALQTGNMVLDMIVCVTIPLFFQLLNTLWQNCGDSVTRFFRDLTYDRTTVVKIIEHKSRLDSWGDEMRSTDEVRNNILQKALSLYIGDLGDLKMSYSIFSFMAVKEESSFNSDMWQKEYGTTADQLTQYSVNTLPPMGKWIDLRPGLQFSQEVDSDESGKKEQTVINESVTYKFRATGPNAEKKIDDFLQEALDWYKARMLALEDKGRYFYIQVKSGGTKDATTRVYKRYKLADTKTFSCLFFREKEILLKLLGHFINKSDKYAIQGFPHKLGLLLHGPPGTGKTSLIKAMAHHTGRNIVSIPLARIETNQELMDIVFDQSFAVKGEDMPIKLSFKDIIFVMEDVDAASPIVHSRSSKGDTTATVLLEKNASTAGISCEGSPVRGAAAVAECATSPKVAKSQDDRSAVSTIDEGHTVTTQQTTGEVEAVQGSGDSSGALDEINDTVTTKSDDESGASGEKQKKSDDNVKTDSEGSGIPGKDTENVTEGDAEKKTDAAAVVSVLASALASDSNSSSGVKKDYKASKYMSKYDKLDLSGLLNVLDGVVDCPNRILIMTTNHPEKLDPALIRPGRIDKIIYLGYLQAPEAKEMIEHYFKSPLSDSQWKRLETALGSPPGMADFTPAEVEQLCAEYDEVDDFLDALEERVLDECEKHMQRTQLHSIPSSAAVLDMLPPPAPLKRGLSTTSTVKVL